MPDSELSTRSCVVECLVDRNQETDSDNNQKSVSEPEMASFNQDWSNFSDVDYVQYWICEQAESRDNGE